MIVLIIVIVLLVIALAAAGAILARRKRSERLQERYGPEYDRLAADGDRRGAEAELTKREKRHDKLDVRDLTSEERDRYSASWAAVQQEFVDDPQRALRDADSLVLDMMRTRGFPDDAERHTDGVSVEHPEIVERYREARAVREATEHGVVDTEKQRHALTSYRALVEAQIGRGTADAAHHGGTRTADAPTTEETR
jgi:hypothetical protein